jgi:hypothetical protein
LFAFTSAKRVDLKKWARRKNSIRVQKFKLYFETFFCFRVGFVAPQRLICCCNDIRAIVAQLLTEVDWV